jgi:hypothetical protein
MNKKRFVVAMTLMLGLVAAGCGSQQAGQSSTAVTVPQPQLTAQVPVAVQTGAPAPQNSLRISQPLPAATITDSVTVVGEGTAFENTILVEVRAGRDTLARQVVTTEAEVGQSGPFTTTLTFTPVTTATKGEIVVYTTSAKDGSIDQSVSVPVNLVPKASTPVP